MNTQDEQSSILIHSHTFILRENILQEHIQDVPHSFVSFLLVFRRLTSINVATLPLVTTITPLLLPLSVTWWIGYITALDYMTVCRPKSFLYVCTQ